MTDHPTAEHRPTTAHIDALRAFLDARSDEAYQGAQSSAAHRAHMILFGTLASAALGYTAASLRHEESWLEGTDRRWWLLLEILDAYKDHPDFPETLRPFLKTPEWQ